MTKQEFQRISESIDFEEKWLFDVLSKHKCHVAAEDIRIAFGGIRKVLHDIKGGDEE